LAKAVYKERKIIDGIAIKAGGEETPTGFTTLIVLAFRCRVGGVLVPKIAISHGPSAMTTLIFKPYPRSFVMGQ
jgi:hypothetical protein